MRISAINIQQYNVQQNRKDNKQTSFQNINVVTNQPYFGQDLVFRYSRENAIKFLEKNPNPLTQGTDGIIYRFGKTAIKVGKTKETSFEAEAEILKNLPSCLKNSQKFIDRFEFQGKDVLVTSFVEGTHKKALEPKDFRNIFQVLLEHDKANIIHGDLNVGNIVFSKNGEISLIDYGAATQPTSTEVELYPSFVTNTNALKLENTGVCDSLKVWKKTGSAEENFKRYLKYKAAFYEQHVNLVSGINSKAYEKNLSTVLQNPTESIINTELQRLKTLDLLEMADTATNYDNNPYSAIKLWNATVENAKKYEEETKNKLQEETDENNKLYFTFQHEIAKCFHSTLSDWRNGTFNWLYEIKNPNFIPRSEIEKRLQQNWNN